MGLLKGKQIIGQNNLVCIIWNITCVSREIEYSVTLLTRVICHSEMCPSVEGVCLYMEKINTLAFKKAA